MKRGMKIHTSSKVSSYSAIDNSINAVIEETTGGGRATVSVDKIFVMIGRAPNTEGVGLEELGVKTAGGFVETGDYYRTNIESIYAIGDIAANSPMLAHVASKQGEIAAEHIAGHTPRRPRIDETEIPAVVFCDPEAASFGLTEGQAAARNIPFAKASFPFRACGKAVAVDDCEGFVKVLSDPSTKKILGAHIAGSGASELIHELLLAKCAGLGVEDIAEMIHAHPTLSEAVMESARAALGRAVHI
jgi:dihydrolipoamide dehydrogenase